MKKALTQQKKEDIKIFAIVFFAGILSRLLLFGAGVLLLKLFGDNKVNLEYLAQFSDAPHYMEIAKNGYTAVGEHANKIVFYPLFPILLRIFSTFIGSYPITGLVISYAAFGVASAYMYKLMRIDYDTEKSLDALLLLFMAPYGMFFCSIHTESLFVMLSVMTVYYARKENWLAAGIVGFFAALSKTQGMLLVVPVVYEVIICCTRDKRFNLKSLFSLLIPLGFVVYLCINKAVQGDFFAFMEHQAAAPWYNSAKWVSEGIATSFGVGVQNFSLSLIIYHPQIIMFFLSVAAIFVGLYKKVRTSYLAFLGVYILETYLQGWMISGPRYVASCFVIYIVMAAIDNRFIKYIMYLVSGLLCLFAMALWLAGYPIM